MSLLRQRLAQRSQPPAEVAAVDERALRQAVREAVLRERGGDLESRDAAARNSLGAFIQAQVEERAAGMPLPRRGQLAAELVAELLGYGPIQPLMDDPTVTEICVNGWDRVYVERDAVLSLTDVRFPEGNAQVRALIEKIVGPLGRRIDESSPMVDARLPDGSRINAIIPPLAIDGPCLTVRKFARDLDLSDLLANGTLTEEVAAFLREAVRERQAILVSGNTGSGKTTLLNVLSGFIPPEERIVTIEDAAELRLRQPHVVRLEARPPNIEGAGEVTIRSLVRNALRMRPDRIVVGEVRAAEALDMLQALLTGHEGGLTTLHAPSPRAALRRLETMASMADEHLPVRAIREQIADAFQIIVQTRRDARRRRAVEICRVEGMRGDQIELRPMWSWNADEERLVRCDVAEAIA